MSLNLHDDTLGDALDKLHAFGVTELVTVLAQQATPRLGRSPRVAHLDATSCHVDGRLNSDDEDVRAGVLVTKGHRRAHRPDLHQVILALIAEHRAGIPVLLRPLSGSSDKTSVTALVERHLAHLQGAGTGGAGHRPCRLHERDLAGAGRHLSWVMTVPATLSHATTRLEDLDPGAFSPLVEGYDAARVAVSYAGVEQRWRVIRSAAARITRPQHDQTAARQTQPGAQARRSPVPPSVLVRGGRNGGTRDVRGVRPGAAGHGAEQRATAPRAGRSAHQGRAS